MPDLHDKIAVGLEAFHDFDNAISQPGNRIRIGEVGRDGIGGCGETLEDVVNQREGGCGVAIGGGGQEPGTGKSVIKQAMTIIMGQNERDSA